MKSILIKAALYIFYKIKQTVIYSDLPEQTERDRNYNISR